MRILFSADHHIKLGQKNVPKAWQTNRFLALADRLNEIFIESKCDLHIIGGDILDVADPSTEEIELLHAFLAKLPHQGIIYTGNHEMISKTISCLDHLAYAINKATNGHWKVVNEEYRSQAFDIISYSHLHSKKWAPAQSQLCFTHVRGEIPPHVTPEIDLSRFEEHGYSMVLAGDLHSQSNTQLINGRVSLVYPGSPLTTSFHRSRTVNTNGAIVIETDNLLFEWHELGDLPQLIRKTIEAGEEMVPDSYDRVIYEVTGDVSQLKNIKGSDLLDKKLNNKVTKDAKLNLEDLPLVEEIALYLRDVQKLPEDVILRISSKAQEYVKDSN
ncbi:DNA repair exonuclease [Bacteriophage Eos]|nr:DNA repair exonuclease [Bacteriophage Eos]